MCRLPTERSHGHHWPVLRAMCRLPTERSHGHHWQFSPPAKQCTWLLFSLAVKPATVAQAQLSSRCSLPEATRMNPISPQYSPHELRTIQYLPAVASVPQPVTLTT